MGGSQGSRKKRRRTAVPEGSQAVTPYLVVQGAGEAIAFYQRAFGAEEVVKEALPDGKILHATLRIGDSLFMMSDEFPGADARAPSAVGTSTVVLHLYTDDVDSLWDRALGAGAKPVMPLEDQFWGERYGKVLDPFGHHWTMSTPVEMSEEEKAALRREAMALFAAGEHPGGEEGP